MTWLLKARWYIIAAATVIAWVLSHRKRQDDGKSADTLAGALDQARKRERARRKAAADEQLENKRSSSMADRLRGALARARRRRADSHKADSSRD